MSWNKENDDCYKHSNGSTIQREYGKTPNGNNFGGNWVYRDEDGVMIDFNQYRSDLCSKYKIKLESLDR